MVDEESEDAGKTLTLPHQPRQSVGPSSDISDIVLSGVRNPRTTYGSYVGVSQFKPRSFRSYYEVMRPKQDERD